MVIQKITSGRQNVAAQHTSTAAETAFTAVTASLPGGAVGRPIKITCSGSVSGLVQFQFGAAASFTLAVVPNGEPKEYLIPHSAFPNPVNSVPVSIECSGGVGTIIAIVEFETGA